MYLHNFISWLSVTSAFTRAKVLFARNDKKLPTRFLKALFFTILVYTNTFTTANSSPLLLVGAAADPYNEGYVPVPPNVPVPLNASELAAITDDSLATGFSFSSSKGQFSSNPVSVVGFEILFDFDISNYASINQITFTWTGLLTWEGGSFPNLRLGAASHVPQTILSFGTAFNPDHLVKTGAVNFYLGGQGGFDNLSSVVHGNIATFSVATELGFSMELATVDNLQVQTLEVTADIVGTIGPRPPVDPQTPPVSNAVPAPSTLPTLIFGVVVMAYVLRRKQC
jgi:hypothetical protein